MLSCCRAVLGDSTVCLGCAPIVYLSALSKYHVAVVLLVMQLWEFSKATIKLTRVSWCVCVGFVEKCECCLCTFLVICNRYVVKCPKLDVSVFCFF